jgi:hypothetical protein
MIPHWLALVKFLLIDSQGARRGQATMSMTTATATAATPMTRQDGGDNDDGEVDSNGVE